MKKEKKNSRVPILIILMIIALVFGWFYNRGEEDVRSVRYQLSEQAVSIIKNFELTERDPLGRIKYRVQAKHMRQYRDSPMRLLSPILDFYPKDKAPYQLLAKQGKIEENQDIILLQGNVRITNSPDSKASAMRIETNFLKVLVNEESATTDKKIHYFSQQIETSAVGMTLYLDQEKLILFSNVHTTYYPTTKKD